jgi:tetratricopeptide (TPR) repeat protein
MTEAIGQEELKEFYNKGTLAFERKNYDYAVDIFSRILSSRYDHLEARHYLHLSLKNKLGSPSSFITNTLNYINRSIGILSSEALMKKGNIQEALKKLEKIIAGNPCDICALKKIAEIFYEKGLIPHAIQNLKEAKSINPNDTGVLKKLGEIYLKKEDYKNAKSNYEQALKINPKDTEVLRSLKNLDALGTIQREFGT